MAATLHVLADGNLTTAVAPTWLVAAVETLDDPTVAARGVPVFITRGRVSAVVRRACRRYHGCRPNQLVETPVSITRHGCRAVSAWKYRQSPRGMAMLRRTISIALACGSFAAIPAVFRGPGNT